MPLEGTRKTGVQHDAQSIPVLEDNFSTVTCFLTFVTKKTQTIEKMNSASSMTGKNYSLFPSVLHEKLSFFQLWKKINYSLAESLNFSMAVRLGFSEPTDQAWSLEQAQLISWLGPEPLKPFSHYLTTLISVSPTMEIRSEQAIKKANFIQTVRDNFPLKFPTLNEKKLEREQED